MIIPVAEPTNPAYKEFLTKFFIHLFSLTEFQNVINA